MMDHVLSMAVGATGPRSHRVLDPVVEVFSPNQELVTIQRKGVNGVG